MPLQLQPGLLDELESLDTHPLRALVRELKADRAALLAELRDALQRPPQVTVSPSIRVEKPEVPSVQVSVPAPGAKRVTVHRDKQGRIEFLDLTDL